MAEHLGHQVLGDGPVAAGELRDELLRIGVTGQGDRREPQAGRPSFGPLVQQCGAGRGKGDARGVEQLAGLALGEAQLFGADLGELTGQAQLMQAEPEITTRGQHRVRVGGKAGQEQGELGQGVWRVQLMQVVDDQGDAAAMVFELG